MQWKCGVATPQSLLLFGLLFAPPSIAFAQQTSPTSAQPVDLSLDEILLRLQNNLTNYKSSVPNFFCDERVVSNMDLRGRPYTSTTTDSIFRLKRTIDPNGIHLNESREIKTVNKVPTHTETLRGPVIFAGAFSNALNVVSLDLKGCYEYRLIPNGLLNHAPALVIDYSLKETVVNDKICPGSEQHNGRAFIDPQTMQIVRLEMRTPEHQISAGTFGPWFWSIDYAPVVFDNKSFWMPETITSKAVAQSQNIDWSFVATYRNYHELNVTSRILPEVDLNPKQ